MSLRAFPLTLSQANALVGRLHRHHDPVQGHRFSIGAFDARDELVGACIVGRPVARKTPAYFVAEVTRLVTNGHRNACSFLYASAARAAEPQGFWKIQTFILASESGASLRAAGWVDCGEAGKEEWNGRARKNSHPPEKKRRYERVLNPHNVLAPALICDGEQALEPVSVGTQETIDGVA
jgi:hypothetical protein